MYRYPSPTHTFEAVRRGRWAIARKTDLISGETVILKQYNYDLDGEHAMVLAAKLAKRHAMAAKPRLPKA